MTRKTQTPLWSLNMSTGLSTRKLVTEFVCIVCMYLSVCDACSCPLMCTSSVYVCTWLRVMWFPLP
jgi:hypothetical protein